MRYIRNSTGSGPALEQGREKLPGRRKGSLGGENAWDPGLSPEAPQQMVEVLFFSEVFIRSQLRSCIHQQRLIYGRGSRTRPRSSGGREFPPPSSSTILLQSWEQERTSCSPRVFFPFSFCDISVPSTKTLGYEARSQMPSSPEFGNSFSFPWVLRSYCSLAIKMRVNFLKEKKNKRENA